MRIGAHESAAKKFENAIAGGLDIGCEAVQFFVKSNRSWAGRAVQDKEFDSFKIYRTEHGDIPAFCHGTYLVNLAAEDPEILTKSITCFEWEYDVSSKLGLDFYVFHPGAPKGKGLDAGIDQIAFSLNDIVKKYPDSTTLILLENAAGQGSTVGRKWSELHRILDQLEDQKRFGVCFDTCHAFAAGYDITTEASYEKVMNEVDCEIGLDRIKAFHLNDSENEKDSNKDRHAHIGEGMMGTEGFRWLINDARFKDHPGTVETPDEEKFPQDLERLKGLRDA
jgi:deoxyribonuclease-4